MWICLLNIGFISRATGVLHWDLWFIWNNIFYTEWDQGIWIHSLTDGYPIFLAPFLKRGCCFFPLSNMNFCFLCLKSADWSYTSFCVFVSVPLNYVYVFLWVVHTAFVIIGLQYNCKSGTVIPPASSFLHRISVAISGPSCFHKNFSMVFYFSEEWFWGFFLSYYWNLINSVDCIW